MNSTAAALDSTDSGTYFVTISPAQTPIPVSSTIARDPPQKTESGCLLDADIVITASWVLSPNSARKITEKAVRSCFHAIHNPFIGPVGRDRTCPVICDCTAPIFE
jgi:hypothetical protein